MIMMTFASIQEVAADFFNIQESEMWMLNLPSFVYFVIFFF
jgi:hypothetical protein